MLNHMRNVLRAATVVAAVTLAGCYHATVDTGRTPNGMEIHKSFAASWIDGLVPPSTIEAASKCPNGVAKVETQLSFVNMLVGALTLGIYTPMDIRVQCAGPTAMADQKVIEVASTSEAAQAVTQAAELSRESGHPVYVDFNAGR
jgi:Bor protein